MELSIVAHAAFVYIPDFSFTLLISNTYCLK